MYNLTLNRTFASMRKSKIPAVVSLSLGEGLHFHRHSSLVPSFSNVHDNLLNYTMSETKISIYEQQKKSKSSKINNLH